MKVFALGYATRGCRSQSLLSDEAFSVCVGTDCGVGGTKRAAYQPRSGVRMQPTAQAVGRVEKKQIKPRRGERRVL